MDNEEIPSVPSTPATPGTPGAPLFGGFRSERTGNGRKNSLLKNLKCFSVEDWTLEDGALPKVTCSLPPPPVPLAKKVGAEFIGTYILMFAGIATAIVNQKIHNSETLIGCAGATGLAVMIIILSTGHISGAHLNPAVTISFAALKHFPWKNVPLYIAAQVLASICASFTLKGVFHPFMSGGVTVPSVEYGQAFALEFIISFNLMFVVTAVATDTRAVGELAGIAVGATVMLNILIAGPATGASMNPVRTLGPAIAANNYKGIWLYIIAPILGALGGAGAYTAVKLPDEEFNSEVGAEFIGTYILMFAGIATAIVNQKIHNSETLIGCAGATGLAIMIIILSTGHIFGAHLNPTVTISFAALKHFPWKNVPLYIAAQVLASICASFTLKGVFHPFMSGGVTVPSVEYGQAFALEFIISFNLMFVVTAVATDTRAVGELAGIAVGATVMLNILIAGPATGASMNPVRTLGPAIAANNYKGIWLYIIAPILGALGGAGAYTVVKLPDEEFNSEVGAEFIGTYILMFAGIATAIVNQKIHNSETLIGCAGATGLAVMIIILSTGHISGAHLNPAVTISFAALKHFPWKNVPLYIAAQVLASICASFTLKGVFHPFMSGGVTVPSVEYGQAFALEFIISFNLMFVVTAVATDTRAVGELAGIAVGATVMLNILIAGPATGASMNPVRTLGPAIAANNYKGIWLYIIAPILGALGGAGAYTVVKLPDEEFNSEVKASSAPGSFRR